VDETDQETSLASKLMLVFMSFETGHPDGYFQHLLFIRNHQIVFRLVSAILNCDIESKTRELGCSKGLLLLLPRAKWI
jgi:hypothetical protein